MTFDDYQKIALTTAHTDPAYVDTLMDKTIWAMGIAGEAGEVIEKWKKLVAYQEGKITPAAKAELQKELGDVVWYIAVFADSLGISLEDVMQTNVTKLASRKERGVIKGAGDNR